MTAMGVRQYWLELLETEVQEHRAVRAACRDATQDFQLSRVPSEIAQRIVKELAPRTGSHMTLVQALPGAKALVLYVGSACKVPLRVGQVLPYRDYLKIVEKR